MNFKEINSSEEIHNGFILKCWDEYFPDYENLLVYPNPWKPEYGKREVTIFGLTENTKLKIYTSAGDLILEREVNDYFFKWNLKNRYGEYIASGIYLCMVEDGNGNQKTGKITIIK